MAEDSLSDADLVALARSGCGSGFDALMARYSVVLSSFFLARLRDADIAQELVQDTFLQAFKGLDGLKEPARFGSWVIQIGHHTLYDYLRQLRRAQQFLGDSADDGSAHQLAQARLYAPGQRPDEKIATEELAALVHEEIERMRPKLQVVLLLALVEELTPETIAERLNLKHSTVRMRLMRGLTQLRARLEHHGVRPHGITKDVSY